MAAKVIELVEANPPKSEDWFQPGHGTERLATMLREWLKENM